MIYLDHAATTPVLPKVLEAAWPYLTTEFGNPSSTYELGHRAESALEAARKTVANWLEATPSDIIFTSGGTEGDNVAITGLCLANPRGKHIISVRTEHEAVLQTLTFLETFHGFEITWLDTDGQGNISLDQLESSLRNDTTMVTLMVANNEIGTLHPLDHVISLAHSRGTLVHSDAVQAAGWIDMRVGKNGTIVKGIDALTFSGHKLGAPKGSGVAYINRRNNIEPLIHGGGQEFGIRSGTENVAWAVGFATAISLLAPPGDDGEKRDAFIQKVLSSIPEAQLTGNPVYRHPGIASFTCEGLNGETLLLELEQRGVIISSGSACAAGSDEPSHVLIACGIDPDIAQTSLRVSFSHTTTTEELDACADALIEAVDSVRRLRA